MVFDGVDDYVSVNALSSTNHTFSVWVYPPTSSVTRHIIDTRDGGDDGIRLAFDTSSQVTYNLNSVSLTTSSTWANEWVHVIGTYDGTTQKLYLNGVLEQSATTSQTVSTTVSSIIGARSFSSLTNYFDGLINDLAFWDEALTATEVTALYNSGTPLDASADSGNYASSIGLQGYWRNDGDTTWTDRSTNSNNGTVSGSPTSIVLTEGITSGRDSQGFYLKDTDENVLTLNSAEYVEIPDSDAFDFGSGNFTIECWARFNFFNVDSTINVIASLGGLHGNTTSSALKTDVDEFIFSIGGTQVKSSSALVVGDWYHVVGTRSGTTMTLYINSISEGGTATSSQTVTNALSKRIGADSSDDRFYADQIDDVRIYSDALSATEVTKNYNAGLSKHRN
tara:strand:- start:274 stop:1455 length:1182 start_codon:yes stop_codon:yes gene_type:complete